MAEAPPSMQLPSGYDEDFVYEVEDDCLCLICHLPLKEPALTRCGHRFCKVCLEEHLKRQEAQNQPYTCPADREGLDRDRDVFPDNATGRKILSMVIKCPSDGCSWTGELRDKEAHLEACPFKIVTCTNENCHVTIKRKDLERHVTNTCDWKILKCEYCKEPHPERSLKDHLENCSKFPLPCPNDCGDSVLREMIPNHIGSVCPLSLVSCPYEEMGCSEKFQRKNVDSHLQSAMREHLDLACVKLNNTQVQLRNTQETTRNLEEKFEALQRQLAKKLPLREPVQTICGHRFCKACLEEHLRRQEVQNQPCTCPADREGLNRDQPDVFPDKATARKILSMEIKCPSDGCSWTGELRNKEAHLEACTLKMVACTNEHCLEQVKRKDLEQHVTITCAWRIIECEYCEEPHPKRYLQVHLENCSEIPLPCPNSCGKLIPREMVPNHIDNDCPLGLVSCPYDKMGCTEKFQRKNVDPHLQSNTREHLDLACVKLNSTQVQLDEQRVQLDETRAKLSRLTQDQLTIIKESQETKIKFEENLEALQKQINTMLVKINANSAGNTLFKWKITSFLSEFMKLKNREGHKTIESDPFYTAFRGYKLKVFVDLNYSGMYGRKLSIGIRLMEGEYDHLLPWPFSLTITFTAFGRNRYENKEVTVVRQLSPTKENLSFQLFSRRPRGGSTADGWVEGFLNLFDLQDGCYIVNDTLSLQVDVGRPYANLNCSTPGSRGLPA